MTTEKRVCKVYDAEEIYKSFAIDFTTMACDLCRDYIRKNRLGSVPENFSLWSFVGSGPGVRMSPYDKPLESVLKGEKEGNSVRFRILALETDGAPLRFCAESGTTAVLAAGHASNSSPTPSGRGEAMLGRARTLVRASNVAPRDRMAKPEPGVLVDGFRRRKRPGGKKWAVRWLTLDCGTATLAVWTHADDTAPKREVQLIAAASAPSARPARVHRRTSASGQHELELSCDAIDIVLRSADAAKVDRWHAALRDTIAIACPDCGSPVPGWSPPTSPPVLESPVVRFRAFTNLLRFVLLTHGIRDDPAPSGTFSPAAVVSFARALLAGSTPAQSPKETYDVWRKGTVDESQPQQQQQQQPDQAAEAWNRALGALAHLEVSSDSSAPALCAADQVVVMRILFDVFRAFVSRTKFKQGIFQWLASLGAVPPQHTTLAGALSSPLVLCHVITACGPPNSIDTDAVEPLGPVICLTTASAAANAIWGIPDLFQPPDPLRESGLDFFSMVVFAALLRVQLDPQLASQRQSIFSQAGRERMAECLKPQPAERRTPSPTSLQAASKLSSLMPGTMEIRIHFARFTIPIAPMTMVISMWVTVASLTTQICDTIRLPATERDSYGLFAARGAGRPDRLLGLSELVLEIEDIERFIFRAKDTPQQSPTPSSAATATSPTPSPSVSMPPPSPSPSSSSSSSSMTTVTTPTPTFPAMPVLH